MIEEVFKWRVDTEHSYLKIGKSHMSINKTIVVKYRQDLEQRLLNLNRYKTKNLLSKKGCQILKNRNHFWKKKSRNSS
jgi:hypothetical protein